jgi:thymidylate synthase (FAD)
MILSKLERLDEGGKRMRRTVLQVEQILDKVVPVLDHGFVRLVDYMGDDEAVVEAARVSTAGGGVRSTSDDETLIRYLMRHRHTGPFEMVELKFHCAMPIFAARQWVRHRTASLNEMSGRYSQLPELTYVPSAERISWQSPLNKQGSGSQVSSELAERVRSEWGQESSNAFALYDELLGRESHESFADDDFKVIAENGGVSRELARINLPLSTYTQWYWKIDLHNLFHFLALRLDEHAQWELQQYAQEIAEIVKVLCPMSWRAFEDYHLKAVSLSGPELEIVRHLFEQSYDGTPLPIDPEHARLLSSREMGELKVKLSKMGGFSLSGLAGDER